MEYVTVHDKERFGALGKLYLLLGEHELAEEVEKNLSELYEVETRREKIVEKILRQVRTYESLQQALRILRGQGLGVCTNCKRVVKTQEIIAVLAKCAEPHKPHILWEAKELCKSCLFTQGTEHQMWGSHLTYTESGELQTPPELDPQAIVWQGENTFCTNFAISALLKEVCATLGK